MEEELMQLVERFKLMVGELFGINKRFQEKIQVLEAALAESKVQLEAAITSLAIAGQELAALRAQPPVVVHDPSGVVVDLSPVLVKLDEVKSQIASLPTLGSGGSDSVNWDKLWSALANIMTQMNKFSKFVDSVSSRFGV